MDIGKELQRLMEAHMEAAFIGQPPAIVPTPDKGIAAAFEEVQKALYASLPIQWYMDTADMVPRGKVIRVPSHEPSIGEFFIIHTDDLDEVKAGIRGVRWVHLRDWKDGDE